MRPYDPGQAHQYYEQHKHLKGRHPAGTPVKAVTSKTLARVATTKVHPAAIKPSKSKSASREKAVRLTHKLKSLHEALSEATKALQAKRATAKKTAKKNSDGKTTVKERQQSQAYRDKNKAKIAAAAKKAPAHKSVSSMTEQELTHRISKIKTLISSAKKMLQEANSLSHSQLVSMDTHLIHDGIDRPLTLTQKGDSRDGS